jgi:prepilin-type N-terminal cleavage/methylation domain-containing protein
MEQPSSSALEKGFTLVETIVAISLYAVMMVIVTFFAQNLYQTYGYGFAQANEVDTARRGVLVWVRDAREMTFAADGAFPLVVVEPYRLGFYSDIDRDNFVEYVEYVLSSTTLRKLTYNPSGNPLAYSTTTPDQTEILSEFVQNRSQSQNMFTYSNASGTVLTNAPAMIGDIRYIDMRIIVNIDPIRSPGEFLLRGSAAPRNLRDTL